MSAFNLEEQSYIALARLSDLDGPLESPVRCAIYAPGLVCANYLRHRYSTAGQLSYAYLVPLEGGWRLMGSTCVARCYGHAPSSRWRTVLDNRHPLAGTGLSGDWRRETQRRYWKVVPQVGLMLQVEPGEGTRGMLAGCLRRITHGKRCLSPKQREKLWEILRERGAVGTGSGSAELRPHYKMLKRRRDLAFRLARLAALDLRAEDAEKVRSLRQQNTSRVGRRMRHLSQKQVDLVCALEAEYLEQRVAAMEALACQLAAGLA